MPDAVVRGRDGYLRVFYDKLGLKFETYDHWLVFRCADSVRCVRSTQLRW